MSQSKFKVGQKVKCVEPGNFKIPTDKGLTIREIERGDEKHYKNVFFVKLVEVKGTYFESRFEAIQTGLIRKTIRCSSQKT